MPLALALLVVVATFAWPIVGYRKGWWDERDENNRAVPRSRWLTQLAILLALGALAAAAIWQADGMPVALAWTLAAGGLSSVLGWIIFLGNAPMSPHPAPVFGTLVALGLVFGAGLVQAHPLMS